MRLALFLAMFFFFFFPALGFDSVLWQSFGDGYMITCLISLGVLGTDT